MIKKGKEEQQVVFTIRMVVSDLNEVCNEMRRVGLRCSVAIGGLPLLSNQQIQSSSGQPTRALELKRIRGVALHSA